MRRNLDRLLRDMIAPPQGMAVDFAAPPGAPALFEPASLTWRVMKNPVALMVGGIAAVILELAEPRVRTGVWEFTSFRRDPVTRMRRTGYAAWITIYAPAEVARGMIEGVVRAHARVEGHTPAGVAYRANDEELLNWVQATAGYGFFEAYRRYVRPLSDAEMDGVYNEGAEAAVLYGARGVPRSLRETEVYFEAMRPTLEASEIVQEFLGIVRGAPILPVKAVQRLMVRAAVEITPPWARDLLGLGREHGFKAGHETLTRTMGALADRIVIESAPPAQSCLRLGLPADYLYR